MTITLEGYPEMPLHPLDLTTQSQADASSSNCVGLIQTDGGLMDTSPSVSDMILGVPFLRNVYTVLAYDAPDTHGVFPTNQNSTDFQPTVGLLSLTNATQAMQEFHNVRVLNQPLSSGNPSSSTSATSSREMSVGVDVLLALLSIIVACVALFGLRWFYLRRRLRKGLQTLDPKPAGVMTTYSLAPNASASSVNLAAGMSPDMSIAGNSARTMVGQDGVVVDEFGVHKFKYNDGERGVSYLNLDPGDPSGWCDTLVGSTADFPNDDPKFAFEPPSALGSAMLASDEPLSSTRDAALAAAAAARLPMHRHDASDIGTLAEETGLVEPLLPYTTQHGRFDSTASFDAISGRSFRLNDYTVDDDLAEFGVGRESMAGVGTAGRSPRIRAQHGGDSSGGVGRISVVSLSGPSHALSTGSFDGRLPSIAPGERLSFSIIEQATSNAAPQNPS
jgi:hypothetical protein